MSVMPCGAQAAEGDGDDNERVQALIRGQRDSMVDELVDRIRTGAAAGDAAIGQLTGRVFRRTAQPGPAPVPTEPA